MLRNKAGVFVKRMAEGLSKKWNHNYNTVIGWIRTRLTFAILCAIRKALAFLCRVELA